jgi:aryl-alcohol dehydrogenase-like predicted oxidoreductase
MVEHGGSVFDTAPSYGASEEVAGRHRAGARHHRPRLLGDEGQRRWPRRRQRGPGGGAGAARQSFERLRTDRIDLIQVHNLGDIPTQLDPEGAEGAGPRPLHRRDDDPQQYDELVALMRREPLDFIGIDYAIDNRAVEETILPLAQDRGIGVLVYVPFGRTRLWNRVAPGAPCRTGPPTSMRLAGPVLHQVRRGAPGRHRRDAGDEPGAANMADNMGAARGRLPDEATRRRMIAVIDALPGG